MANPCHGRIDSIVYDGEMHFGLKHLHEVEFVSAMSLVITYLRAVSVSISLSLPMLTNHTVYNLIPQMETIENDIMGYEDR